LRSRGGYSDLDELIFIANDGPLADLQLPNLLGAVKAATLHILKHPDESFPLFVDGRPELDDELNRHA
jgi:putative hydroxymethylpyrimidine transport system substrate-binding protein